MRSDFASDQLADTVIRVLEDAAFVFAERSTDAAWTSDTLIMARITLAYDGEAELRVAVSPMLATVLAANLLGLEPDSDEARASAADAVAELTNMLAGTLAVELFGRDVVSRIGVPVLGQDSAAEHDRASTRNPCRATLRSEEGERLDAIVTLDPGEGARP